MQFRGALLDCTRREYIRLNGADPWTSIFTRTIALLVHPKRRPGPIPSVIPSFLELFHKKTFIMTLPTDSRQARISRDARNCIFWSLLKTVQRQCYARFQSLETASTEVVDDIINGVIGPNWSSPELSRDVAICLCLWGRDVYGQTMVSSIEHKVFRSAKYYPMVMESSPRFL